MKLIIFLSIIITSCSQLDRSLYIYESRSKKSSDESKDISSYGFKSDYKLKRKKVVFVPSFFFNHKQTHEGIGCEDIKESPLKAKTGYLTSAKVKIQKSAWLLKNNLCDKILVHFNLLQYIEDPHGHAYYQSPFYNLIMVRNKLNIAPEGFNLVGNNLKSWLAR